ncbi:MAG TPA: GNAT family N-acetyltransferase [Pyrinomonadaceae bacterium]|nr:GNAT family N-acetyltransferase [Pyrinomonadaceae bacterium]
MTAIAPQIQIRPIESVAQMKALERLQQDVWGWDDLDTTPLMNFIILKELGGMLLGAFDGEKIIGFAFGFIGCDAGRTVFHSHMLAVHPSYREHGIGCRLKLAQRTTALERGFDHITWTFDPLQSTNAHLNFHKLGVVSNKYKVNFYGEQSSSPLHRSIGTDRLWVHWFLKSRRVVDRLQATHEQIADFDGAQRLIDVGSDGLAVNRTGNFDGGPVLIEIPEKISVLQRENPAAALAWRKATRAAFADAFAAGYVVDDFLRGYYLLQQSA